MSDDDRHRRKEHEREREGEKLFHRTRAVDLRRFVHVLVHVRENARGQEHGGRDRDPGIDEQADEARPVHGIDAEEVDPCALAPQPHDEPVDRPHAAEHIAETDHRDEARHRIGENGERPPQFFALDALLIDEKREAQPAEITQKRRQYRPNDIPQENLSDRIDVRRDGENGHKISEPDPVDEFRRRDRTAVIGESGEHRKYNGQNIEDDDAYDGERERDHVKFFVEERLQRLFEIVRRTPLRQTLCYVVRVFHVFVIQKDRKSNHEHRGDAAYEHGDGVIPFDPHDRIALHRAERKKPDQISHSHQRKVYNQHNFRQNQEQALSELLIPDLPRAHEDHGKFCRRFASL